METVLNQSVQRLPLTPSCRAVRDALNAGARSRLSRRRIAGPGPGAPTLRRAGQRPRPGRCPAHPALSVRQRAARRYDEVVPGTDERVRMDAIREQIRSGGRRWTIAKSAIVEALLAGSSHLSAQQIHEEMCKHYPHIDPSTVYRVLLTLADEGVVHTLDQPGEARYGLADEPHHHAICSNCGLEAEIPAAAVARVLAAAGTSTGFQFGRDSITLTGRCPKCRHEPR